MVEGKVTTDSRDRLFTHKTITTMQCTTTRLDGLYSFKTFDGKVFRTRCSPREVSGHYLMVAQDERGNIKVVLTDQVDFSTFRYLRLQ